MELEALDRITREIEFLGGTLVAISPEPSEANRALKTEKKIGIDILSDPGNTVASRYGIRFKLPDKLSVLYRQRGIDLTAINGDDSWTLPLPARYIINQSGKIWYARVNVDYTQRPEPEETLQAFKLLQN